jgi:hypothetical protein
MLPGRASCILGLKSYFLLSLNGMSPTKRHLCSTCAQIKASMRIASVMAARNYTRLAIPQPRADWIASLKSYHLPQPMVTRGRSVPVKIIHVNSICMKAQIIIFYTMDFLKIQFSMKFAIPTLLISK